MISHILFNKWNTRLQSSTNILLRISSIRNVSSSKHPFPGYIRSFSSEFALNKSTPHVATVRDVLATKPESSFWISDSVSIDAAINHLVENQLSSSLTVNDRSEITGIFTARDILRLLHSYGKKFVDGKVKALSAKLEEIITKKDKMVCKYENI